MEFSQRLGSVLWKQIDSKKMGHCRRNLLLMYRESSLEEIGKQSPFALQETYMLITFLQFGLLMRAQIIPFELLGH